MKLSKSLILIVLMLVCRSSVADDAVEKYALMFNLMIKISQFITWPDGDNATPLKLCLLGGNPFGPQVLDDSPDNTKTHLFNQIGDVDDDCHVLFIAQGKKSSLDYIVKQVSTKPMLTVSELDDFMEYGGMVSLNIVESKIKLNINIEAANKAHLKLDSSLLFIANRQD